VEQKRAQLITQDIEAKLWETGVLSVHSAQTLLNTVFYYNGIVCGESVNIYMYVYSFCSYNSHSRGQFRAPLCAYAY
jgi:hypothetical protein